MRLMLLACLCCFLLKEGSDERIVNQRFHFVSKARTLTAIDKRGGTIVENPAKTEQLCDDLS